MEEIIKQDLANLQVHNTKQNKLINVLMEELTLIHNKLSYINGTKKQIYNEKMWTRLTKNSYFLIFQFLGLKETLSIRLVSNSFNNSIIRTFNIYQYKFEERLQQINLELQQIVEVQQDLPYLNTYHQEIDQVTNENFDMKKIRCTKNPSKIVVQVMTAALVQFNLAETKEKITWEQIQLFLRNHQDVYLKLTSLNYLSVTDKQLMELEKNLEGVTIEECQNEGVVVTLIFNRFSSILDYCKLPVVKTHRLKSILLQEIKKIEQILPLFKKYV